MKSIQQNLAFYCLLFTSSCLVFLFFLIPHYIYTWDILEEWFAIHGLIYYRDFCSYHFFLAKIFFIPLRIFTNWNLEIDPFIGLGLGICSLLMLYLFGKKFLSSKATCVSLIFFTIFFWYAATGIMYFDEILMGFLLSFLILYIFKLSEKQILKPREFFILGILIALTELTGQLVTLTLLIIAFYACYTLINRIEVNKNLVKIFLFFISGVVLPFCIVIVYFFYIGAFNEFFFFNITYYFRYAGYDKNLLSLPFEQLIIFYTPLLASIMFLIFGKLKKKKKENFNTRYIVFILLGLSTIPFIIFSLYHPHHLNYALPIMALIAGMTMDYALKTNQRTKMIFIFFSCTFIIFFILFIIPWYVSKIIFPPNLKITNDLYPGINNSLSQTIDWLKNKTSTNSKIMVVGTPLVYIKSNRLPSSRPAMGLPHTWLPFSQGSKEILSKPPLYWIIDRQFTKRLITDYNEIRIVNFLDSELNRCYSKQVEYETWQIWKRICK